MAKKKTLLGKVPSKQFPDKHCRDCGHSYDWHSKALDGHLILCRCPFKMDGGKWCIFLSDCACERFIPRKEGEV